MRKILKALTEKAYKRLSVDDCKTLKEMIGSEVYVSDENSDVGGILYMMPDGETAHEDFLILETINP
jgi:hypothetical protein